MALVAAYDNGDRYELESYDRTALAKALKHADRAVQLGPNESQAHAQLARVQIIRHEYGQALEILNKARELDPQNFYPWYLQGVAAEKMRDPERAAFYLGEAEKRATRAYQHRLVNLARQNIARSSGDYAKQERLLLENIRDNPDDPTRTATLHTS